ncbi:Protein FAR1-RELATED SEQUENCE 5, partial [Bienertia sinuspersici]
CCLPLKSSMEGCITLKFWHGGWFKVDNKNKLCYVGGEGKTFKVDPDELCGFDLRQQAKSCGGYGDIEGLYYLVPGMCMNEGLKKVFTDDEVRRMGELTVNTRCIELYVQHGPNSPESVVQTNTDLSSPTQIGCHNNDKSPTQNVQKNRPNKLNPIRAPQNIVRRSPRNKESGPDSYYDWLDCRPESPIPLKDLIGQDYSSGSDTDPEFDPSLEDLSTDEERKWDDYVVEEELNEEEEGSDIDEHAEDGGYGEPADTSDDEYHAVRDNVNDYNQQILELAEKLSDYLDSDAEKDTPLESEEDDISLENRKLKRRLFIGPDTDFREFRWQVGQRFATRNDFREAVTKYGVYQGRNVSIVISDNARQQRIGVKCGEGCPFRLYASWESRRATYVVKTVVPEHTCVRNMERNKQLKSSWMAKQLLKVFKARPHWPSKEIIECIRMAYRVMVKRDFAYKVKYRAHKLLHGSMKEHYSKVGRYVEALKLCSPGTDVHLVTYIKEKCPKPVFQRLYMCFEGVKKGWIEGCRRIICVDACFLKTFLGGQLISAVGRDGNDQMYPIAWAVVEGENNLSWEWFFTQLQASLSLEKGEGLVIISDEHQAILNGVASVFPLAEHRHCARHIFALWHKTYRGDEMKLMFWTIAKSYNMADYEEALEQLRTVNEEAAHAFLSYNPKLFCRAFMTTTCKADVITNNMAETFNGYIINARSKHVLYMLEDIRASLMQRLVIKKKEMEKCSSTVCPRIQIKLDILKEEAAKCTVLPSSETLFQVNHYLDTLTVDIEARKCTCRMWDMCGYPCCHAIAAIFFLPSKCRRLWSLREEEGAEVVIQVGEGAVVQLVIQVGEGAVAQLQVVVVHGQGEVAVVVEEELLFLEDMECFMLQMGLPSPM